MITKMFLITVGSDTKEYILYHYFGKMYHKRDSKVPYTLFFYQR